MRRRDFLKASAATAALAALPAGRALAGPWGSAPDAIGQSIVLPSGVAAQSVLEVFMYGGLGPFETFYVVQDYGRPEDPRYSNEQWYLFGAQHEAVFSACGIAPVLTPFATDALGRSVKLGPALAPLVARPDLLARMRILVQRHDLEPHEAAIPMALSGMRLGSARMAGIGAAAQRWSQDREVGQRRRVPYAYVLYPDTEISTDNLRAASAVGLHPGASRPLDLRITSRSDLPDELARSTVGSSRSAYDRLVAHYAAKAQERYSIEGKLLRSRGLADHAFAAAAVANADALRDVLTDDVLDAVPGAACGFESDVDTTAMGLQVGTHLLTHPSAPATYVTVVDGGLYPASGGGGYDVHTGHLVDGTRNLLSMLTSLAARINEPGEGDPTKIDLDRTMVVLNTEFGRTPFIQPGSGDGTNHHPYGYVTVLIGGPIGPEQKGIVGAIGPDGWADRYVTPIESRAAVLAAMGMWPFTHESFAVGDIRGVNSERDGTAWLREIVLGRPL